MMHASNIYDVAIIGGGLAGLSLSIQLVDKGYKVVLFEKERYPFHKVCGEYISMESWDFLERLGLPLSAMNLPKITSLILTAPNGASFKTKLPLGGFGISRFRIDHELATMANQRGVALCEETKVENVVYENGVFAIHCSSPGYDIKRVQAAMCCGAYGKRSNIDVKWRRNFIEHGRSKISNYISVKYHIKADWPQDIIGLHNFQSGYAGISKIEDGKYCFCYLTTAAALKENNNSIGCLEHQVLCKNPALKKILESSTFLETFPITISQISFSKKKLVEHEVLMIGDAAGMITPLCGNGMSMALHSSVIAAECLHDFLSGRSTKDQLQERYQQKWKKAFEARMRTGRLLQRFFGAAVVSNLFVRTFKLFPFLAKGVIRKTHGLPF